MNAVTAKIDRFPSYDFLSDGRVISRIRSTPITMKPIRMGQYVGLQLLMNNGIRQKEYLHRLICEAFHGPCPDGMQCRHLDGDKSNNAASNLSWGTKKQNEDDRKAHGTTASGENNPMAKLDRERVNEMRKHRRMTGDSYSKIARMYDVSTMTAYRAISQQSWVQ